MTDRLADLLASSTLNGIDFVEIANDAQTELRVHFLNTVTVDGTLAAQNPVTITGGESVPAVPVAVGAWAVDDEDRPVLSLSTPYPGDFSFYTLTIASSVLDPYYAAVTFTFKARCPTDLDCAEPCGSCPPTPEPGPAIDYLSKDFASFQQALLDYSAVAYPAWVERSEADLGTMLLELIASVGDDLSYLQDRIAAEATLATATERRSLVRLARLVDYEPGTATSAWVTVQVDVSAGTYVLPPGVRLIAGGPDGARVYFEIGDGMVDPDTGELSSTQFPVDPRWNRMDGSGNPQLVPYWWDDSKRCLPAGSTTMWIRGHGHGLQAGDPQLGTVGTALLIDTQASSSLDSPIREVFHLTGVSEQTDPLYGIAVTQISWSTTEQLAEDHDLTLTVLAGNLLPATEGQRYTERFEIEPPDDAGTTPVAAVVRPGPQRCCATAPIYLHTLEQGRLAWLDPPSAGGGTPAVAGESNAQPEIVVTQVPTEAGAAPLQWRWRRSLLDAALYENAFTVDPVSFLDLRSTARPAIGAPLWEYDGDGGDSIRFGDDVFGNTPPPQSEFDVTYRVTQGVTGNVGADTITVVDPGFAGLVLRVTNPFPAAGASDEETDQSIRRNAPYAFRSLMLRAVRPEDYDTAADTLPWVLDSGTVFRWTGSWLTVFTTAQAVGAEVIPVEDQVALVDLLNARRLAGYEVYCPAPQYVSIDLIVTVCALPSALRGEVEAALLEQLGTGTLPDGSPAFFAPDQFIFGQPLERSELEIAAQGVPGVDGVVRIRYRRRGLVNDYEPMPETVTVGSDQIIRCDNDPSEPDHGSLRIVVKGGK